MANKHRGEVEFEADGKAYTLRLSINDLANLEGETGLPVGEILALIAEPKKWTVTFARAAMFVGLRKHHPEVTKEDAGDLIMSVGGILKAMEIVTKAMQASFPEPKEGNSDARPPKGAGIGATS